MRDNVGRLYSLLLINSLFNLIVFVDDNKKQLDGFTKDICNPGDFVEKFSAFGFESIRVNGSDIREIYEGINQLKQSNNYITLSVLY